MNGFVCIEKKEELQFEVVYGDVSIAVILVLALVGEGVPFEIVDVLIDLFPTFRNAGDFVWFGV